MIEDDVRHSPACAVAGAAAWLGAALWLGEGACAKAGGARPDRSAEARRTDTARDAIGKADSGQAGVDDAT